jgi:hypothetical protein
MKSYTLRPDTFTLNFNVLFQVLRASVLKMADLEAGMQLIGTVRRGLTQGERRDRGESLQR